MVERKPNSFYNIATFHNVDYLSSYPTSAGREDWNGTLVHSEYISKYFVGSKAHNNAIHFHFCTVMLMGGPKRCITMSWLRVSYK